MANGHSYLMDFIPIDESLPMIALKGMPSVPEQRQAQEAEIIWLETRTSTPTAAFFDGKDLRKIKLTMRRGKKVQTHNIYSGWKHKTSLTHQMNGYAPYSEI